jgi:RNA polymerase sigma factor (sigma-70 family)
MPTGQMTQAIQHLRRAVLWRDGAGLSDAQLLEHFIERRDEAAFETLVRRHGPMVLGVCRRLLRNGHDADDAFQATFLVLVRKAACIAPKEMVGHWLYGVAYQTALKSRAVAAKRRTRERPLALMPEPETKSHELWDDLQSVLDQELSRLPYKYRVPFVLCDLERKSYKEAARQLGWPEGTLSVRLARARKMLAKRLTRHGFAITGAALAVVLSQNTASACVPPTLVSSTVKAAGLYMAGQMATAALISGNVVALTEGVLKTMLVTKIKTAIAVFVTISVLGIGGGAISYSLVAGEQRGPKGQQEKLPAADDRVDDGPIKKNAAQTDEEKLQGIWKLVSLEEDGQAFRGAKFRETGNLGIDGDRLFDPDFDEPEWAWHGTFKLDTSKNPKRITIFDEGPEGELKFQGIYSLEGDDLKICINEDGTNTAIPTEFKTTKGSPFMFVTFRREKPADAQKKKEPVTVPAKPLADNDRLQGTWNVVSLEVDGKKVDNDALLSSEPIRGSKWMITGDKIEIQVGDRVIEGTYTSDPSKNPKRIDATMFVPNGEWVDRTVLLGIYSLQGETLKLYLGPNEGGRRLKRPKEFQTKKDDGGALYVLQREAPGNERQEKSDKGQEDSKGLPIGDKRFRQY